MSQIKRKPLLNRKDTRTLLNAIRVVTTAGAISLTVAGWGLLAQLDTRNIAQAKAGQAVAVVAPPPDSAIQPFAGASTNTTVTTSTNPATATPTPQPIRKLDIVQWVQDASGNSVAVVQDRRGTLWYVMGSDVPRLEQGQAPLIQPQPVRTVSRSRAS